MIMITKIMTIIMIGIPEPCIFKRYSPIIRIYKPTHPNEVQGFSFLLVDLALLFVRPPIIHVWTPEDTIEDHKVGFSLTIILGPGPCGTTGCG